MADMELPIAERQRFLVDDHNVEHIRGIPTWDVPNRLPPWSRMLLLVHLLLFILLSSSSSLHPNLSTILPSKPILHSVPSTHLTEVELSCLLGVNTLDLDQRLVWSSVPLSSLVGHDPSLGVETTFWCE
jgi:hypothetical protein